MLRQKCFVAAVFAAAAIAANGIRAEGVRISERFGYDPVDATANLRAALNSGEKVLIVDKQEKDWFVRPLRISGRKDLTIVFEDGARIVAKRGEFKSPWESMFVFEFCTNVAIRGVSPERCGFKMWHDDYYTRNRRKPNEKGYVWSEWRHGLQFLSCAGVTLENISSNDSGGDGLYIGSQTTTGRSGGPCQDVVVRNCIFDHNNRQGISVISVRGLVVEDTLLSNTRGTAPAAGIDFEPNHHEEVVTGVVMRRCRAINNAGNGFEFYMNRFDKTSEPTEALFEDCVAISNKFGFIYSAGQPTTKPDEPMNHGNIAVRRCRFSESRENGLVFWHRPFSKGTFTVADTVLENNCVKYPERPDISITVSAHGVYETDTYVFENLTVIRPNPGKVISLAKRKKPYNGKPSRLMGEIKSIVCGEEKLLVFDEKWNAENLPYRAATDSAVPRVAADLGKVEIVDARPGRMVEIANPPFFRSPSEAGIVFYADRARDVRFKLQQTLIGKRDFKAPASPIRIYAMDSKRPVDPVGAAMPADPHGGCVSLKVPGRGFYRLSLVTGGNGVAVLATDVPLAYNTTMNYVNFVAPTGGPAGKFRKKKSELSVYVPQGEDFSVLHMGATVEMVGLEILDPSGKVVRHEDALADLNAMTFRNAKGGLWTLRTFEPAEGLYEDFDLAVSGVPGWLFASPEKYWKPVSK